MAEVFSADVKHVDIKVVTNGTERDWKPSEGDLISGEVVSGGYERGPSIYFAPAEMDPTYVAEFMGAAADAFEASDCNVEDQVTITYSSAGPHYEVEVTFGPYH